MRVIEHINRSLRTRLELDPDFHIIGEDILDPYGGAFKATKGLSTDFPDRIMTTPISEAAIVGFATGMALKGKPVCVEIMFGDFITLAMDQLINHASKLAWVYNDQINIPLVIRAPMGGKRGYGSTHSQSLEKHLCGIPGLNVTAVSEFSDIESVYADVFARRSPTVIIENKVLYSKQSDDAGVLNPHSDPDLAIVTYGGSVGVCHEVAKKLAQDDEIDCNVIAVEGLSPLDGGALIKDLRDCKSVLCVEEGTEGWNFASEISRALMGQGIERFASISAPPHPIPSARSWELELLPNSENIFDACYAMLSAD